MRLGTGDDRNMVWLCGSVCVCVSPAMSAESRDKVQIAPSSLSSPNRNNRKKGSRGIRRATRCEVEIKLAAEPLACTHQSSRGKKETRVKGGGGVGWIEVHAF